MCEINYLNGQVLLKILMNILSYWTVYNTNVELFYCKLYNSIKVHVLSLLHYFLPMPVLCI